MRFEDQFSLDTNIHFLNHGSFGACPKPVFNHYQELQRRLEKQPVLFLGRQYHDLLQIARGSLANYLKTNVNNIVFVPNATYAVNLIARSFDFNPGDEILTSNHEYGACDFIWTNTCLQNHTIYRKHALPYPAPSDEEMVELFWQGVTNRTKLIFLSHITSPTALHLPVEAICQRAREAGILTLIDGAHAPGQIPIDLDQLEADFYTGNCHKWLLSPKGAGFLYANPNVQDQIKPLIVSWGYQVDPEKSNGSRYIDLLTWTGTHDPSAYLSVPKAIQFQKDNHWDQVQEDCHAVLVKYLPKFSRLTGYPILYHDENQFSQMACIEIPIIRNLTSFKNDLYDQYKIEIPTIDWNHRHFLRISYQAYNQHGDLDALMDSLERLIPIHRIN